MFTTRSNAAPRRRLTATASAAILVVVLAACGEDESDSGGEGASDLSQVTEATGLPCDKVSDEEVQQVFDANGVGATVERFETQSDGECAWDLGASPDVTGKLYVDAFSSVDRDQAAFTQAVQLPFSLDGGIECTHYGNDYADFPRTICTLPQGTEVKFEMEYKNLALPEGFGRLPLITSTVLHQELAARLFSKFFGISDEVTTQ